MDFVKQSLYLAPRAPIWVWVLCEEDDESLLKLGWLVAVSGKGTWRFSKAYKAVEFYFNL
jgi:hypothetical protein